MSTDWRIVEAEVAEQEEYVKDLEVQILIAKKKLKNMKDQLRESAPAGRQLLQG